MFGQVKLSNEACAGDRQAATEPEFPSFSSSPATNDGRYLLASMTTYFGIAWVVEAVGERN
jgi:hypothetical protein